MKIQQRKTSDIIPYGNNPRINDMAVDKVAMSLEQYGWQQPIVVDGDGVIIAGHTRWKAARKLGMDSCPVVVADNLTPAQVKAYRIADNRTGELAEWDKDLLDIEIQGLIDLDFDIELTGFSLGDFCIGEPEDYSDFDEQLKDMAGLEDKNIVITVPAKYAGQVVEWLSDGESKTAPGMGKGVLRKCGLL